MRCGRNNPCGLKVRRNAARLIQLNEYLTVFHEAETSEKKSVAELNEIFKQYDQQLEQAGICSSI